KQKRGHRAASGFRIERERPLGTTGMDQLQDRRREIASWLGPPDRRWQRHQLVSADQQECPDEEQRHDRRCWKRPHPEPVPREQYGEQDSGRSEDDAVIERTLRSSAAEQDRDGKDCGNRVGPSERLLAGSTPLLISHRSI